MAITEQKIIKIVDGTTPTIQATVEQISTQGALIVKSLGGLVTVSYDYIGVAYPLDTTEVYTFKTGGAGGTTVATITVVYTDATKVSLSTVTKS